MIEFAIVVIGALIIIGVTTELFQYLIRRADEQYEERSKARLFDEIDRHL